MATEVKKVIDIQTKGAESGVKSLKQQIKELREAMAQMEKGSEEWTAASAQLADTLQKQKEITEAAKFANKDYGATMQNVGTAMAGVTAGITAVTSGLSLMGIEIDNSDVGMIKFTQNLMAITQALTVMDSASKAWKGLLTAFNAALDQKIADTTATAANTAATEANTAASAENAAAKKAQATASGENAAAMATETAATGKATTGIGGLSGAFTKLAKALKISKAALGIWGIAIAAVTAALTFLIKKQNEEREKEMQILNLRKEMATSTVEATGIIETYYETLNDSNASYEQRLTALNELKKQFPEYKAQLTTEGELINGNNEYLKANIELLKQQAQLQVVKDSYIEDLKRLKELEEEVVNIQSGKDVNFWQGLFGTGSMFGIWWQSAIKAIRLNNRKDERTDLNEKLVRTNAEIEEIMSKLGSISTAATWKDQTNQVLQFKASVEATRRSLAELYSTFQANYDEFVSGGKRDLLTKFVDDIKSTLAGAGLDAGKVFGEGIMESLEFALQNYPRQTEIFGDKIGKSINEAVTEAGDNVEEFFPILEKKLQEMGDIGEDIKYQWLRTFHELSIESGNISTSGFFSDKYVGELKKKLKDLQKQYDDLIRDTGTISTTEAQTYMSTINDWNQTYATIYNEIQRIDNLLTSNTNKQSEVRDKLTQAIKDGNNERRDELSAQLSELQKVGEEWTNQLTTVRNANKNIIGDMETRHEAFVQATAQLEKYNQQLAISQDTQTRLNINKEQITGEIAAIEKLIQLYNQFSSEQQSQLKSTYDWYKSIFPEMAKRIELEREYFEEMSKGNKDAQYNRNKGTLELEKQQINERLELNRQLIAQMNEDLKNGKEVDYNTMVEANKAIAQAQYDLAQKELEIENNEYQHRTELLNRWIENSKLAYDSAYTDLETIMLEHQNIWNLGAEDYNYQMEQLEAQRYFLEQRMNDLESWREQDLINEADYLEQRKQLNQEYANLEVDIEREKTNRQLKIHETYYNGLKSITSTITSLMGALADQYEQDSEEYRDIMTLQTWITGFAGSLDAFVSGVKSGIPAPYNFILAGVLSAATLTETALTVAKIKSASKTSGGSTTSAANSVNTPVYETLAYETNSEINGNISDQRVYVVESDITDSINTVQVVEDEASF